MLCSPTRAINLFAVPDADQACPMVLVPVQNVSINCDVNRSVFSQLRACSQERREAEKENEGESDERSGLAVPTHTGPYIRPSVGTLGYSYGHPICAYNCPEIHRPDVWYLAEQR